jgi:chemotaxis protein methyltransferase CheR
VSEFHAIEDLEIELLLEGVFRRYGHDFRGYRRAPLKGRLQAFMRECGLSTISALQERVLRNAAAAQALLRAVSTRPAALFDDAEYCELLRAAMIPWLRSCPSPRIWVAECVTPEEVYGLAILLAEEGLLERTQIFATAENEALLNEARDGSFALDRLPGYEHNYRCVGGRRAFSDYCTQRGGQVVFSAQLGAGITWAQYSLASDASFNEFQLIVCRQAMKDFGSRLYRRALQLFHDSMPVYGLLSVDRKEGLETAPFASCYKALSMERGLYRRVG